MNKSIKVSDSNINETISTQDAEILINLIVTILGSMAAISTIIITMAAIAVPVWVPILLMAMKATPAALKILEEADPIFKQVVVISKKHSPASVNTAAEELVSWLQAQAADISGPPTNYDNEVINDETHK